MSRPAKTKNTCCEREIENARFNGVRQEQAEHGQKWECPRCKRIWVHDCDEAEGCAWWLADEVAA